MNGRMTTLIRSTFLAAAAFLAGCANIEQDREIASAAAGYILMENPNQAYRITVQAVDQGYARALATPLNSTADPAVIFLTKAGGSWKGILLGTAFDPAVYRELGIPPKVQLPNS